MMIDFYAAHKTEVWIAVILTTIVICLVHYLCFGPKKSNAQVHGFVRRFSPAERFLHWATLITFLIMLISGMMQVFGKGQHHIGPFHGHLGALLFILYLIDLIFWSRDALFKTYDLLWLKSMGGYLSRSTTHLQAGRFNAGQKVYFWLMLLAIVVLVTSFALMEQGGHGPHSPADRLGFWWSIHGLAGCVATIIVIGHAYLSIVANPQTARVLWDGTVCRRYAREHHSRWEGTEEEKC